MKNLYLNLYKKTAIHFTLNILLLIMISIFFFFIFQTLVTRHLINISDFFQQRQNLYDLNTPLILKRQNTQDELQLVETSINKMQSKLNYSFKELNLYKNKLENLVQERTSNLRFANKKLRHEIRERKKIENQLRVALKELKESQFKLIEAEKNALLGRFIAGIAHEMNNPMMGALNFVQYCLKHTIEEDKLYNILLDTETEIKKCMRIVTNLLEITQTEMKFNEKIEEIDIIEVLNEIKESFSNYVSQNNIIVYHKNETDLTKIYFQYNKAKQIFFNLYKNAIYAIKNSEKKEIHISIHRKEKFIQIKLVDTGCGIADKDLKKIFDPFYTTKSHWQSTGLGLSISKTIVENIGGKILVKSKVGQGTIVEVLLPYK